EVKKRRNNELLALQNEISEADNQPFLGRDVQVLVEGLSKAGAKREDPEAQQVQLTGRTMCDRIAVFDGNRRQIGQTLPVTIYDANAHTLFGTVVTQHVGPELFSLTT
ncbi:MAG: TRAM domain-containing protein, partial [Aeoliella sp.]